MSTIFFFKGFFRWEEVQELCRLVLQHVNPCSVFFNAEVNLFISNYMVSNNYSYLIIYLHSVVLFQVFLSHHHDVLLARISLTLSRHFSLSFIASDRSSGLHPISSHSCLMYVRAGRPVLPGHMWGSIGVHHL